MVPVVIDSKIFVNHQDNYNEVQECAIVYFVNILSCIVPWDSEVLDLNFLIR